MGNHTHEANIPTTAAINTKSPHQQPSLPPSPTAPPANFNQNVHSPGTNNSINTPDPNTPAPTYNISVAYHNLAPLNQSDQSNLASTILIPTAATDTTGPSKTPACDVPHCSSTQAPNPNAAPNPMSATPAQPPPPPLPTGSNSTPNVNYTLTILKSEDFQIRLLNMTQGYNRTPNWQNYQDLWRALSSLAQFRVQSMSNVDYHQPAFHFQQSRCSYASWIKNISNVCKFSCVF
jgi:hypothetical protein